MEGVQEKEVQDGTLAIRRSGSAEVAVIGLVGELDLANASTLEEVLEEVERGGGELMLDMRALEFIDSTGIALLVAAHRRFNCNGQPRFTVVPSRSDGVCHVLELTGIAQLLPSAGHDGLTAV
jgi:anti-sigma B factor antagonist